MRPRRAFTLLELLVTVGIIAVLVAIIIPAVAGVSRSAKTAECVANLRQIALAHTCYATDHRGQFAQAGLPHNDLADDELSWVNVLRPYYGGEDYRGESTREEERRDDRRDLVLHSPLDRSPHWPKAAGGEGRPIEGVEEGRLRRTSYGMNGFLDRTYGYTTWDDLGRAISEFPDRLSRVKSPSGNVLFLVIAFEGPFAASDHVHAAEWQQSPDPVAEATNEMQVNAVDGPEGFGGRSTYAFVDGHAEALAFEHVYQDFEMNRFDPVFAPRWSTQRARLEGGSPE